MNLQGNKTGKHDFSFLYFYFHLRFFLFSSAATPFATLPPLRFLCVFSIRFLFRLSSCFSRFFFNYICKYVKIYILIILYQNIDRIFFISLFISLFFIFSILLSLFYKLQFLFPCFRFASYDVLFYFLFSYSLTILPPLSYRFSSISRIFIHLP